VTRDGASALGAGSSGGTGMDCWMVIGRANYKISRSGPIALPGFSTLAA
jgi:hypothetical protein